MFSTSSLSQSDNFLFWSFGNNDGLPVIPISLPALMAFNAFTILFLLTPHDSAAIRKLQSSEMTNEIALSKSDSISLYSVDASICLCFR